jgi:hypothetical protein
MLVNFKLKLKTMHHSSYPQCVFICLCVIIIMACGSKKSNKTLSQRPLKFDSNSLIVKESSTAKKIRGQVLYLPVYSNIPYFEGDRKLDLSAVVAIHNTDLEHRMTITKVLFFDNDGKLVLNCLNRDSIIQPLGATNFFIPERDKSGTGTNLIIEWVSDTLINEPLVESIMLGSASSQGISFSSSGRIIRETK